MTPQYQRIARIARGLDRLAGDTPRPNGITDHAAHLRRIYHRQGVEAFEQEAARLGRHYQAAAEVRQNALHERLNRYYKPWMDTADPAPKRRRTWLGRVMAWVRARA